jgi:hypothetical protein
LRSLVGQSACDGARTLQTSVDIEVKGPAAQQAFAAWRTLTRLLLSDKQGLPLSDENGIAFRIYGRCYRFGCGYASAFWLYNRGGGMHLNLGLDRPRVRVDTRVQILLPLSLSP